MSSYSIKENALHLLSLPIDKKYEEYTLFSEFEELMDLYYSYIESIMYASKDTIIDLESENNVWEKLSPLIPLLFNLPSRRLEQPVEKILSYISTGIFSRRSPEETKDINEFHEYLIKLQIRVNTVNKYIIRNISRKVEIPRYIFETIRLYNQSISEISGTYVMVHHDTYIL